MINRWFQDQQPRSYKIQLQYLDLPKHAAAKYMQYSDTPYRFATFADANQTAASMFQNIPYRIVSSADESPIRSTPMTSVPWVQDQQPKSHAIQLQYLNLPKHITEKYMKYTDTPYRFATFADASQTAANVFPNVPYRIVSSTDEPHWSIPAVKPTPMYNIVGTKSKVTSSSYDVMPEQIINKSAIDALRSLRHPLAEKAKLPKPQSAPTSAPTSAPASAPLSTSTEKKK